MKVCDYFSIFCDVCGICQLFKIYTLLGFCFLLQIFIFIVHFCMPFLKEGNTKCYSFKPIKQTPPGQ